MGRGVLLWLLPILLSSITLAAPTHTQCLDFNGAGVDWWFIRKLPYSADFLYADSNNDQLILNPNGQILSDVTSPFARTVQQAHPDVDRSNLAFVFYNDQPPKNMMLDLWTNAPNDGFGRGKGLLTFEISSGIGFHLVHSIPGFPKTTATPHTAGWTAPNSSASGWYPKSSYKMAHSLVCYSFDRYSFDGDGFAADHIAGALMYNNYYLTKTNEHPLVEPSYIGNYPNVVSMLTDYMTPGSNASLRVQKCKTAYTCARQGLNPLTVLANSLSLSIFAKNTMLKVNGPGNDIWRQYVFYSYPSTLSNGAQMMFSQTWAYSGSSTPLGSVGACTPGDSMMWSVRELSSRSQYPGTPLWSSSWDNSKLAYPINPNPDKTNWVCIGDSDRTVEDQQRGGGAICFDHFNLAVQLNRMTETIECEGTQKEFLRSYEGIYELTFEYPTLGQSPMMAYLPPLSIPGPEQTGDRGRAPGSLAVQIRDVQAYSLLPQAQYYDKVVSGGGFVDVPEILAVDMSSVVSYTITDRLGMYAVFAMPQIYICQYTSTACESKYDAVQGSSISGGPDYPINRLDAGMELALLTTLEVVQAAVNSWNIPALLNLEYKVLINAPDYGYSSGKITVPNFTTHNACLDELYRQIAWLIMYQMAPQLAQPHPYSDHWMDHSSPSLSQSAAFYNGFASALLMMIKDSMGEFNPHIIDQCALNASNPSNVPAREMEFFNSTSTLRQNGFVTEGWVTAAIWDFYDSDNDWSGGNPIFGVLEEGDYNAQNQVTPAQLLAAFATLPDGSGIWQLFQQLAQTLSSDQVDYIKGIMRFNYLPLSDDMCSCNSESEEIVQDDPSAINYAAGMWVGGLESPLTNRGVILLIEDPVPADMLYLQAVSGGWVFQEGYCPCTSPSWKIHSAKAFPNATSLILSLYTNAIYHIQFGLLEITYTPSPWWANAGYGDGMIVSMFEGLICNFFVGTLPEFQQLGPTFDVCPTGPQVYNISLPNGVVGDTRTLFGSQLDATETPFTVLFGDEPCEITAYTSDTQVTCKVPQNIGTVPVTTNFTGQLYSLVRPPLFQYASPTFYTDIYPSNGPAAGGTLITILGQNFGAADRPAILSLSVGGSPCAGLVINNPGNMTCTTPSGVGEGTIFYVSSENVNTPAYISFHYDIPVLTQLHYHDASTNGGEMLTIVGQNFGVNMSLVSVSFGQDLNLATVNSGNDSTLFITIPPGAGKQTIIVTVAGQASDPEKDTCGQFIYDPPTISHVSFQNLPTCGGGFITIFGTNFGPQNVDWLTVSLQGKKIQASYVSPAMEDELLYTIPTSEENYYVYPATIFAVTSPGIGALQNLTVSVAGQAAWTDEVYYAMPEITSISPENPYTNGGFLLITGTNLVPLNVTAYDSYIRLNGQTNCTNITWLGCNNVSCYAPPSMGGLGDGLIEVIVGRRSAFKEFKYAAPIILGVNPAGRGHVYGIITIFGNSFVPQGMEPNMANSNVTVDGHMCEDIIWQNATSISCTVPNLETPSSRSVPIVVEINGQVSNTWNYSIDTPVVTSIEPSLCSTTRGCSILVTGYFPFDTNYEILINGTTCTDVHWLSKTKASGNTLPWAGADLSVIVRENGKSSDPNNVTFSFQAPRIQKTSHDNTIVPMDGGDVYLLGSNFGPSPIPPSPKIAPKYSYIVYNGEVILYHRLIHWSDNSVRFNATAAPYGDVNITLVANGQSSSVFTAHARPNFPPTGALLRLTATVQGVPIIDQELSDFIGSKLLEKDVQIQVEPNIRIEGQFEVYVSLYAQENSAYLATQLKSTTLAYLSDPRFNLNIVDLKTERV